MLGRGYRTDWRQKDVCGAHSNSSTRHMVELTERDADSRRGVLQGPHDRARFLTPSEDPLSIIHSGGMYPSHDCRAAAGPFLYLYSSDAKGHFYL